jgi:hypothetical protein
MKTFITKIVILLAIVTTTLIAIWQCPGVYTAEYACIINKVEMLKNKQSPRIILIGGSNLLKIRSNDIEKSLHYPVANLAYWWGLNYKYFLEELKQYIKPGDVMILVVEYNSYSCDVSNTIDHTSEQIFFMLSPLSRLFEYTKDLKIVEGIKAFDEATQQKAKTSLQNLRSGNWRRLTERGLQDYYKIYDRNGGGLIEWPIYRPLLNQDVSYPDHLEKKWGFLNDFYMYAKNNNIKVFLTFPPFPDKAFIDKKIQINAIYDSLIKNMKMPILGKPEDFIFPENNFKNSAYHLDNGGEILRTNKLIELLKNKLVN